MRNCFRFILLTSFLILLFAHNIYAAASEQELQQSMSDTLDAWRDGRYEQLFESLSHRGRTSKESFVKKMRQSTIKPACCWQKIENFKVLNEKVTEATVYAKIGLEGNITSAESSTREFKLSHEENTWKMQLADIVALSGIKSKKKRVSHKK